MRQIERDKEIRERERKREREIMSKIHVVEKGGVGRYEGNYRKVLVLFAYDYHNEAHMQISFFALCLYKRRIW